MAVIAEVTLRGVNQEQYDAVRELTGWLDRVPDGGLAHLTWWEGEDCHNLDAWESEAAFGAFGEQRLGPAMAALGIAAEPEVTFHAAHEVFTPHRGVVAATAVPPATDNVALVRQGYASFAAGDVPAVLALFAADISWRTPASLRGGGQHTGPEGVAEFFGKELTANYAELTVTPETFVDGGDTVVVQGTHRGSTVGGITFEIPFVHVWTMRGGKATAFVEYMDTAALLPELGAG